MRGYPELMIKNPYYGTPEYYYNQYLVKHREKQNKGESYTRDSERMKTYRAEWAFEGQIDNPKFKTIEEAQKCAKKIYKSKTWIKLWKESINGDVTKIFQGTPNVVAKTRNGRGNAGFTNGRTVTLDLVGGLNKYTLLHELTHCLGHMHHGRSFRQCLLKMVGAFIGAKEKKILKAEFKKSKLACGEPRKPMTFDKWNEARIKMEILRGKNDPRLRKRNSKNV